MKTSIKDTVYLTYHRARATAVVEPQVRWFAKTDEPEYKSASTDEPFSARLIMTCTKATAKYHTQSDRAVLGGVQPGRDHVYEAALREPELARGTFLALSGSGASVQVRAETDAAMALADLMAMVSIMALPFRSATQANKVLAG